MTTQKVPLVVYENGVRRVIGEAVVDTDGTYMDVTGEITVTDEKYRRIIQGPISCLSLGSVDERRTDVEHKTKKGRRDRALRSLERRKHKRGS